MFGMHILVKHRSNLHDLDLFLGQQLSLSHIYLQSHLFTFFSGLHYIFDIVFEETTCLMGRA